MGKTIEIECTADVFIDEYVEEISDEVLFEEALSRLNNTKNLNGGQFRNDFIQSLNYDNTIVDLIASSYNLNIIQVSKLKEFLEELL